MKTDTFTVTICAIATVSFAKIWQLFEDYKEESFYASGLVTVLCCVLFILDCEKQKVSFSILLAAVLTWLGMILVFGFSEINFVFKSLCGVFVFAAMTRVF